MPVYPASQERNQKSRQCCPRFGSDRPASYCDNSSWERLDTLGLVVPWGFVTLLFGTRLQTCPSERKNTWLMLVMNSVEGLHIPQPPLGSEMAASQGSLDTDHGPQPGC